MENAGQLEQASLLKVIGQYFAVYITSIYLLSHHTLLHSLTLPYSPRLSTTSRELSRLGRSSCFARLLQQLIHDQSRYSAATVVLESELWYLSDLQVNAYALASPSRMLPVETASGRGAYSSVASVRMHISKSLNEAEG